MQKITESIDTDYLNDSMYYEYNCNLLIRSEKKLSDSEIRKTFRILAKKVGIERAKE